MFARTTEAQAPQSGDYKWWRAVDQLGTAPADPIDVLAAPLFDFDWCAVRHVSLGATPHQVKFCRDTHTLMVFDRGSFVEGERWVAGTRLSTSGPLDIGLDVVPANVEFQALAGPGSNIGCTMISVIGDAFAEVTSSTLRSASNLQASINLDTGLLSQLIERLRQVSRSEEGPSQRQYIESICMVLFREVLHVQQQSNVSSPQRSTGGGLSPRVQRLIKDFLREHDGLDQKVTPQLLADLVGVSRFHFTRAFKVSFGLPPHKYLLNLRLRKAADLLRDTRLPITDIALDVGFSCSSEFARAFKEAMEYTPREFRQLQR
jgi:AraC family transcriptional regulator